MEVLRIEDCVLILENGYRVEHLLHHKHLIHIAYQTKPIEYGYKNMREIELKEDVLSLWVLCINVNLFTIFICA